MHLEIDLIVGHAQFYYKKVLNLDICQKYMILNYYILKKIKNKN